MPQNEYMEKHKKRHGERPDTEERARKRQAREGHKRSEFAQKVHGIRAKLYHQKRFKEKATMRKTISMHQERDNKHANDDACLLYTSPSPRDLSTSRMPSSA